MRLMSLAAAAVTAFSLGTVSALAQPPEQNTITFQAECETLGTIDVTVVARGAGAAFWVDGQLGVVTSFAGRLDATLEIAGQSIPIQFEFGGPPRGEGLQDRVDSCQTVEAFTDPFTVTRRDVRDLDLDPSLIGRRERSQERSPEQPSRCSPAKA
jgi:hypothetical protein